MRNIIKKHKAGLIIIMVTGFVVGYSTVNLFLDILLGGSMF